MPGAVFSAAMKLPVPTPACIETKVQSALELIVYAQYKQ